MVKLNWGGEGYPEYQGYLKKTSGEQTADTKTMQFATSAGNEFTTLKNMANTQFAEQQSLLNNVLIPQLTQWAQNPPGFGLQAMAAMKSQALDTIGGQFAMQKQQMQNNFATQNMAGLQSGVQQALSGQLGMQATGMEAGALQNLSIADAQMKMQQQQIGMSGLAGATQLLGQAPQAAGLAISALGTGAQAANAAFNQQNTMAQQGTFWSNLATGVVGGLASGGLGLLTGGASTMLGGMFGGAGLGGGISNMFANTFSGPLNLNQAVQNYPMSFGTAQAGAMSGGLDFGI